MSSGCSAAIAEADSRGGDGSEPNQAVTRAIKGELLGIGIDFLIRGRVKARTGSSTTKSGV